MNDSTSNDEAAREALNESKEALKRQYADNLISIDEYTSELERLLVSSYKTMSVTTLLREQYCYYSVERAVLLLC